MLLSTTLYKPTWFIDSFVISPQHCRLPSRSSGLLQILIESNYIQLCLIDHYFQFPRSHLIQVEWFFLDYLIIEHNY